MSNFLDWLHKWHEELPTIKLNELGIDADRIALVSEDLVVGFCRKGNLASPNVGAIVPEVVRLFNLLHETGVRQYLLFQDTHDQEAMEFTTYPPHCIKGTEESQTIPELAKLPYANEFKIFEKNSLSSFHGTGFGKWLEENRQVDTFIVVGDCTDICVYQAAVELRTRGDYINKKHSVIVPADCVATYDLPVESALKLGATPHDAQFLHLVFLYHMKLNGIQVVKNII